MHYEDSRYIDAFDIALWTRVPSPPMTLRSDFRHWATCRDQASGVNVRSITAAL